jgi:hypothetical protein
MDPLMGSGERYEGVTDSGADVSASVGADLAQAAPEGVQSLLGEIVELETFRGQMVRLTLSYRRRIVEQALVLIEQSYVHLPHKVAMHAVNTDQAWLFTGITGLVRGRFDHDVLPREACAQRYRRQDSWLTRTITSTASSTSSVTDSSSRSAEAIFFSAATMSLNQSSRPRQ